MVIRGVVLEVGRDETTGEPAEIVLGLVTRGDSGDLKLQPFIETLRTRGSTSLPKVAVLLSAGQ